MLPDRHHAARIDLFLWEPGRFDLLDGSLDIRFHLLDLGDVVGAAFNLALALFTA